jgi:tripartite-type tricarboxylate transporter receptor subunit TctC
MPTDESIARARMLAAACVAAAVQFPAAAHAQKGAEATYPARPVRMVVTSEAGSAPDVLARLIGVRLSESLGQQFVVDNRAGAGGVIGYEIASRAAPDGYTTVMSTVAFVTTYTVHRKLPYHPLESFTPIARVASSPYVLVVSPQLPAKSVKELIELARARPGKLNYGSPGNGTAQHLTTELLKARTGVDMVHIPYKSGGSAVNAILAGEAQLFFSGLPPALPQLRAGRLRPLAVTTLKRSSIVPEIPTMAESGMPGIEVDQWHAVIGPAKMPAPIVDKLAAEIVRTLAQPEVVKAMLASGGEPNPSTPAQLRQLLRDELAKWYKAAEAAGLRGQL